jgi:rhodanese-related sulfurtransferase
MHWASGWEEGRPLHDAVDINLVQSVEDGEDLDGTEGRVNVDIVVRMCSKGTCNVLEWRLDPRSVDRLSIADRYDLRAIVLCQEGYTSSLAAAALQEIGLWNATDVVGGYEAWKNAGLPTELNVAVWEGEEGEESEDGRSEMAPSSLISGTSMGDGVDLEYVESLRTHELVFLCMRIYENIKQLLGNLLRKV